MLVSGGASALAELCRRDSGLVELEEMTGTLLSRGFDITRINAARRRISGIKGGRLLARSRAGSCMSMPYRTSRRMISRSSAPASARPARSPATRGISPRSLRTLSGCRHGINWCPPRKDRARITQRIIASNTLAREAAAHYAAQQGYRVVLNEESLHGPVEEISARIHGVLAGGGRGVYVWGGEPTVVLPAAPGQGGRSQHLALCLARRLRGTRNVTLIAAGTDGTDGPTDAAGGVVDGRVFDSAPEATMPWRPPIRGPSWKERDPCSQADRPGPMSWTWLSR